MCQKFYPVFGRLGGETSAESLEICQVKLLLIFLQSTIQKTINWWSIFFGDAAKKHKQIDKTIIKHRYRLGWFIYRSKYNLDHCKLIIYWFWITIIVVIAAGASCRLVVPNEILTQYLKNKGYSGLEKFSLIQETQCSLNTSFQTLRRKKNVEADFDKTRIEFENHENLRSSNCEKPSSDRRNVGKGTSDLLDNVFSEEQESIPFKKYFFYSPWGYF